MGRPSETKLHYVRSKTMKRLLAWLLPLLCLAVALTFALSAQSVAEYDLLIKNGHIVDGTGSPSYSADVAVRGDRIAKIGKLANARARQVIEARGLVVAPGFIDMLGQSEIYVLIDPR